MARPEFIAKEDFREWKSRTGLNAVAAVDSLKVSSWIARRERQGRPIQCRHHAGGRRWRLLDIVAAARADGVAVTPPATVAALEDIADLLRRRDQLRAEVAALTSPRALEHILPPGMQGRRLLTSGEIVAAAQVFGPRISGVYFLVKEDRVVYVGQSVNILGRLMQHQAMKEFDKVAYISCPAESLNAVETVYILSLQPELNRDRNGRLCFPLAIDALIAK